MLLLTRMVRACAVATLILAICAGAQEAKAPSAAATPTVNQILDRYIAAMGGRAAIETMLALRDSGRIKTVTQDEIRTWIGEGRR